MVLNGKKLHGNDKGKTRFKYNNIHIAAKSAMNYQIIDKRNIIISSYRHELPSNNSVYYLALN